MARASTSLPTPVSPRIEHVDVAGGGALGERLHPPHALVGARETGAPAFGVVAFAARARAGAREQRRRVAAVVGIAGDADARRACAGADGRVARTPPPARARFRRRARATAARIRRDRTGRPRRSAGRARGRRPAGRRPDAARTRATENVPPVASARAHSHSTRPSNSACESGCARAAARAGRFGCTISTSEPIAIASPGSTRTRVPGASLRSWRRVPFALPRSSTSTSLSWPWPTCRRRWRRDAFASSSFTSTPVPPPRPTITSPRAGRANVANCFGPMTSRWRPVGRARARLAALRGVVQQRARRGHALL